MRISHFSWTKPKCSFTVILFLSHTMTNKILFSITIVKWSDYPQLPSGLKDIHSDFDYFFTHSFVKIHAKSVDKQATFDALNLPQGEFNTSAYCSTPDTITPKIEEKVHLIITESSNASCDNDPIPSDIVKQYHSLISPITKIVNSCWRYPHKLWKDY